MRRIIPKSQAKRITPEDRWREFEEWVKRYPGRRPTFWSDGGMVYASIAGTSFHLHGSFQGMD